MFIASANKEKEQVLIVEIDIMKMFLYAVTHPFFINLENAFQSNDFLFN